MLTGRRLGVYQIQAVGAGGMGEVYRARDTRSGATSRSRSCPSAFAADPDRLARFEREARVLASLNHPNIAAIYGLEDADGVHALVMELVEGETLAERIARGPHARLPRRSPIARQIADALEAAHEQGIVHRDLKPANVKLTPDGPGQGARLRPGEGRRTGDEPVAETSNARRRSRPSATQRRASSSAPPAYMSPEQARGQPVDKRTDIWAFGCVLYEMLTGRAAFARRDVVGHASPRSSSASRTGRRCRADTGPGASAAQRCLRRMRGAGCATSAMRVSRSKRRWPSLSGSAPRCRCAARRRSLPLWGESRARRARALRLVPQRTCSATRSTSSAHARAVDAVLRRADR